MISSAPARSPLQRLLWQGSFNSLMVTVLVTLSSRPIVALALLLVLVGASIWTQGRWSLGFAAAVGVAGWMTEAVLQAAGPAWRYQVVEAFNPTGVPLYMLASWALVGLFSVALADTLRASKPS
jgi:hypothetical protein